MRDIKCPVKKKKVHELLERNAQYQAANNCVTNSRERQREIDEYCNREFILPIKELDEAFYAQIVKQND